MLLRFQADLLLILMELIVANAANQKILSTKWPQMNGVNPSVETVHSRRPTAASKCTKRILRATFAQGDT